MPSHPPKHHQVVAVIVTYGERSHFAKATISGAFKCGVSKVILVSNGKTTAISERDIGADQYRNIEFIHCEKNVGSAGGFNRGIKSATEDDKNDYVWLLDDDNLPDSDALERLIEWHGKLSEKTQGKNADITLFSFRGRRKWQRDILGGLPIEACLPSDNSCYGFHINELKKILRRKTPGRNSSPVPYARIPYGPYGGLFASRKLLESLPLPNSDLVLYFDDIDYSMELSRNGVRLYLIGDSAIDDLEPSWDQRHGGRMIFTKLLFEKDTFRVFFGVRNCLYIERRMKSPNKFIFYINIVIFSFILISLSLLFAKPKQAIFIFRAMKDGLLGNLKCHTLDSQSQWHSV